MTIPELYEDIKLQAHDRTLTNTYCKQFIDKAISLMEARGEYPYQTVKDETVTVLNGASEIVTLYEIKRVINIKEITTDDWTIGSNGYPILNNAVTSDTTFTVNYIRYSPRFDGTDAKFIVPSEMHNIVSSGAAYIALVFNNQPEQAQKLFEFNWLADSYNINKKIAKDFAFKRVETV